MRLHVDAPLQAHTDIDLPPGAARHAQVRRVQPGDVLWLFDGHGSDWPAQVLAVGRSSVQVRVGAPQAVARELSFDVTMAVGMPANERMDTLVEKATELGVARIQPLLTERSVLRLSGERAERKQAHWQAIAVAACEQCGRARVPLVLPVCTLAQWLAALQAETSAPALKLLLSLIPDAQALPSLAANAVDQVLTLSGPEGGLTPDEEASARARGFVATALGPRVLRADTAPLAVLAWLGLARGVAAPGTSAG